MIRTTSIGIIASATSVSVTSILIITMNIPPSRIGDDKHLEDPVHRDGLNREGVVDDAHHQVADFAAAMESEREPLQMIEQLRAQIVDHPLADRNRDVVVRDGEQSEQRVQDDEADARGDEQLAARHRRNPRAHERRAAQHVVDENLERPRLEHFRRGGKQHAGDRDARRPRCGRIRRMAWP